MAIRILLIIVGAFLLFQGVIRLVAKVFHLPAPAFLGPVLDSDLRRVLQPPRAMIARSGIQKGMTVLELGCGSGAYTPFVARALGKQGRLHALDIQPEMLRQLERKLSTPQYADIQNVLPVAASAYELPFVDGLFDLVYMVTVFQEIPDRRKALREARRVLKSNGILAITEWLVDPDYPLKRTTVSQVTAEGFRLEQVAGGLWHYTARFRSLTAR